jgi:predicted phage-related endonuclease
MTITPYEPDSAEWHAMRGRHIGGSEIAALFDLPRDQVPAYLPSRFALWHIKAGHVPSPRIDNPRVKWGLKLEQVIAEAAAETWAWPIRKGGYASDATTPGLGCSLDFIIDTDPLHDGPGVLETKSTDWLVHKRSWTDDEPPLHILLQLQHQLAATGYKWGAVAALVGGNDLRVYQYDARPKLIAEIRQRVTGFWASIDEGKEPPVDGSDSASAVLRALHTVLDDDALDMTTSNEWAEAAQQFYVAGELRRSAEKEYEAAKNRVAHLMDGHARAFGNGWQVKCAVTPENPGRPPKPGELVGKRAETRRYSVKEMEAP